MTWLHTYLQHTWQMIAAMAPYLWLGFGFAVILHRWIGRQWISDRLGKPGLKSIAWASLIGVPMPLCSCGVIPVTASLREKGASRGASAAFLASTPQTGVDSILATYGMLGPIFAGYRLVVAFLSGALTGLAVNWVSRRQDETDRRSSSQLAQRDASPRRPSWLEAAQYGMVTMPPDIARSLILGFLLAGLISAMAPDNLLAELPGGLLASMVLTTVIAIPFYICATGSIPLAIALIDRGLPTSTALILLIAGPATNIATIVTMRKTLGGRQTLAYLAVVALSAWIAAYLYHLAFGDTGLRVMPQAMEMGENLFHHISGALLIALLIGAYWKSRYGKTPTEATSPVLNHAQTAALRVGGMTCNHCRQSVQDGLSSLPFAQSVTVDLASGQATVYGNGIDQQAIRQKLEALGFHLTDFRLQQS